MTAAQQPQLKELGDFLNPILVVPVGGKTYQFKAMSAENGLFVQTLSENAQKAIDAGEPLTKLALESEGDSDSYMRRVLGDTYDELMADGVSAIVIKRLLSVVMAWTFQGFESAERFVAQGGKAPALNREQRRTATRTRTAAASTTRTAASRTTTSTRKGTAKVAPGKKSSSTGTASKPTSKTSASTSAPESSDSAPGGGSPSEFTAS
ncbi:DUF7426 family protein [Arthrobacter sp. N1]|uniref:DUF7426 family protein n=1 Tax=Arthrobacter sp. N1 TaxID=619291 RepID=UPI003BAE6C92